MLPVPPRITRTLEAVSDNRFLPPPSDVIAQRLDGEALAKLRRSAVGAEGAHQILVRDAEPECLLDSKAQVEQIDALRVEVYQDPRFTRDLFGAQRQHLDENVAHPSENR